MKKYLILLLLLLSLLLTLLPLFHTGLFNVHDPTSVIRFFTLKASLLDGQFPAAWTNLLNHGYGYPLFLYYAPVFTYLGTLLSFLIPSYIIALKLSLILLTVIAGWGMYKLAGPLAAVAYTLLPYHALTLYVRGSYAELVTMSLLPWLLYFWQKPLTRRLLLPTTIITSLFLLSHNSLPFLFLPALIIWIIYYQRRSALLALIAFISSFFLSSWFLLPIIFERGFVQIDTTAAVTSLRDHALNIAQLWHSPWGYGGSSGGVDGMSFMLGKFQLVLAALSLAYLTIKRRFTFRLLFFLLTFLLYSFASLDWSLPLWGLIPSLSLVQFPWRSLAFATFGLAALIQLPTTISQKIQLPLLLVAICLLLYFNLKFFTPQNFESYTDADLLTQEKLDTAARDKIPEYLPVTMTTFPITSAPVTNLTRSATHVSGIYTQESDSPLYLATAYMPQWQLMVNGQKAEIKPSVSGGIETVKSFTPGSYALLLSWHRTVLENIGLALSLFALLFVIGYTRYGHH